MHDSIFFQNTYEDKPATFTGIANTNWIYTNSTLQNTYQNVLSLYYLPLSLHNDKINYLHGGIINNPG
jgi:hypothetical protein